MHDSSYFTKEFTEYKVMIIETMDGIYRRDFYVPTINPSNGYTLKLFFESKATYNSFVHFDGNKVELTKGKRLILVNCCGTWIKSDGNKSR